MLIRRESGGDVYVIRSVTEAAFAQPDVVGRETTVRGAFRYAEPLDRT